MSLLRYLIARHSADSEFDGAGDRDRTGTLGKERRILSPVRLPVPPLRRNKLESEAETSDSDWLRGWGSNPQPTG